MYDINFIMKIEYIINRLKEKGYDPYEQLMCYVLLDGNPYYITSHGDARSVIKELDVNDIRKYLDEKGVDWRKFLGDGKYNG